MIIVKFTIILLLTIISIRARTIENQQSQPIKGRIIGGIEVSITLHAHQVSLRHKSCEACAYLHTCGGSILNEDTIVTAAHCVANYDLHNFIVIAGSDQSAGSDGNVARIKQYIKHEHYNASIMDYDIALLFLSTPFTFNYAQIAPISLATIPPTVGSKASITGWGIMSVDNTATADKLQQVNLNVLSREECEHVYGDRITVAMFCAGITGGGKDACQKDSGGPLLVEEKLAGIISWSIDCARPEYPGVYVNVTHLRQWIETNMVANSMNI